MFLERISQASNGFSHTTLLVNSQPNSYFPFKKKKKLRAISCSLHSSPTVVIKPLLHTPLKHKPDARIWRNMSIPLQNPSLSLSANTVQHAVPPSKLPFSFHEMRSSILWPLHILQSFVSGAQHSSDKYRSFSCITDLSHFQ